MYDHIRTFERNGFRLDLWDTHRVDHSFHDYAVLSFVLMDDTQPGREKLVFEGEMSCPPQRLGSNLTVVSVLLHLSIRPDEADDIDAHLNLTPEQLAWLDRRGEDLREIAAELMDSQDT